MTSQEIELRKELIFYARKCETRDMLIFTQGNFSTRLPGTDYALVTPSDIPYDDMEPEDIVIVDMDGKKVEGKYNPTSEAPIHTEAYKRHPGVGACAHVESPYINALSALNIEIKPILGNFVYLFGGEGLAMGPSIQSGNQSFAEATMDAMGGHFGVIWKNHGAFCVGENIKIAFKRCMAAEQCARVYYLALALGRGEPDLVPEEIQANMIKSAAAAGWTKAI